MAEPEQVEVKEEARVKLTWSYEGVIIHELNQTVIMYFMAHFLIFHM